MRYEEKPGPRRITANAGQRGSHTGLSNKGTGCFGGVFVLVGLGIILVGLKVIPVDYNSVHAPYWVLSCIGLVFAGAGGLVWNMGARQARIEQRRLAAMNLNPGNPAYADYPWEPRIFESAGTSKSLGSIGMAAFITLFMVPFNAVFILEKDVPWPVYLVVGVFDLIAIFLWIHALMLVGRALKFGKSRIVCDRIPLALGTPVEIRWQPATGIGAAARGRFTLRCVKEWYESSGSGRDRSSRLVHEEQWCGSWIFEEKRSFHDALAMPVDLKFTPPPGLPPTLLNSNTPVFWEFEVHLELAGFDFLESYLVPIY